MSMEAPCDNAAKVSHSDSCHNTDSSEDCSATAVDHTRAQATILNSPRNLSHAAQSVPQGNRRKRSRVSSAFHSQPCQDIAVVQNSECHTLKHLPPVTQKISPELREIILKYVSSESVIRCLELAEFTSLNVLSCMNEAQIRHLEEFVGHTCSLIDQVSVREMFLGPIFSHFPEQFRLPSGAVLGLMLAVAEIRKHCVASTSAGLTSKTSESLTISMMEKCVEASAQTEISIPSNVISNSKLTVPDIDPKCSPASASVSPQPPTVDTDPSSFLTAVASLQQTAVSSDISTPSNTVALMAAAFQAAAVAAVTSGSTYPQNMTLDNSLFPPPVPNEGAEISRSSFPMETVSSTPSNGRLSACNGLQLSCANPIPPMSIFYEEETVDLDRLKHHASTNATRLASRQFLNAHLVRGRDFDVEMEISTTPEGIKRVTGIFYCHLCREKRERTSAVRFSIARNRYPVLSNVLSHLKTHFHYRGQLSPQTGLLLPNGVNSSQSSMANLALNPFGNSSGLIPNQFPYFDFHGGRYDSSQLTSSMFDSQVKQEPDGIESRKANPEEITNSFISQEDRVGPAVPTPGYNKLPDPYSPQPTQAALIS